ncbi:MAG: hypothetical protein ACRDD7_08515 [Peptostreptococcaceae bacterium]
MIKLHNSFLGYGKDLHKLTQGRTKDTLEKRIRYEGVVMSKAEFIVNAILDGFNKVEQYEHEVWMPRAERNKIEIVYRIYQDDLFSYDLNKTEYLFAKHVIENGYTTEEAITEKVNQDLEELAKEIVAQEIEKEIARQKELQEKQEEEDYTKWVYEQAESYPEDSEKFQLAKEIFESEVGCCNPASLKRFIILIENIDNEKCKRDLVSWCHNSNTGSKKVFSHLTGISIGNKPYKEVTEIINSTSTKDFTGLVPYKKRKEKQETEQEKYYIRTNEGKWQEETGEKITKLGYDFFIQKSQKGYKVTEGKTGVLLGIGLKNKQEVKDTLKRFETDLEKVEKLIQQLIEKNGLSPLYVA